MSCRDGKPENVDDYIAEAADFARPILGALRDLIRRAAPGLEEVVKWGRPCYRGRTLVCGYAAFKSHVSLSFFHGSALASSAGVLFSGGDNASMRSIKFSSSAEIPKAALRRILTEAVRLDANPVPATKPRRRRPDLPIPDELLAGLNENKMARAFFETLPPSCRREYAEYIAEAKRTETRQRRLALTLARLAEGRRWGEEYRSRGGPERRRPRRPAFVDAEG